MFSIDKLLIGVTSVLVVMPVVPSAHAQTVSGNAVAVDGDSLKVGSTNVRLFGIDAPEFDQTCAKDGGTWACGSDAKAQLSSLVDGQSVDCQGQGVDQHGRMLAVCWVGRDELNEAMVSRGWAMAYRQFSEAYIPSESRAKSARLGIWSSTFISPSEYRLSKLGPAVNAPRLMAKPAVKDQPPAWKGGCVIKGNRNRRGQWIYHIPGMPYYDRTRAEEMFCSEEQARAAGYRRAIVQ